MARFNSLALIVATLLGGPQLVSSHTWVEQLNRVASNGTLVGPNGFPSGWTGRQSGAFNDATFTNRIPGDGFAMCKQTLGQQVGGFPALTAAPGDFVSLRYQENGHVTIPDTPANKPLNRGTVFIYGTTEPKGSDTLFDVHRQWTTDGKGGDGRGRLLATRNYDDGQCYQINDKAISKQRQGQFPHEAAQPNGQDVWCQSAVQLPEDLTQNSEYTLYWVWSWPTLKESAVAASKNGQFADFPSGFQGDKRALTSDDVTTAELYTSCSTIKVQGEKLVSGVQGASISNTLAAFTFSDKTDYNNNAIKEQLQNQFLVNVDSEATPSNGTQSSAPTTAPTPTTSAGVADSIGNARIVTVTAPPVTLYSMITVTVPAQSTPTQNPAGGEGAAQASISPTPFLKGRHVRGKDSWNFNQYN
ncbi:hypothetical protein EsH8_VII_000759 [Colletotrichum jinshuiense]